MSIKTITLAATALIGVSTILSGFYTVSEGTVGIKTRNGKFVETVNAGLGFKLPWVDQVHVMETRNMKMELETHVYSADTQQYNTTIAVNFDISPADAEHLFKAEGLYYADRRLRPLVESTLKEVGGKYNAQRTIQERDKFGADAREAIVEAAKVYNIRVTEVQVRDLNFTKQFEQAIEQAMLAKAKVEEERNVLEQKRIKAETIVVEAAANANAEREKAKGQADAQILIANANAKAIEMEGLARADAARKMAEAVQATPALADYERALASKNWNGQLPTSFVPNTTVPILNIK